MNVFDIIIVLIALWAVVSGYRSGVITQLCGLAGILIGVWAAFRFSNKVGEWLGCDNISPVVSFIVVLVVSIVVLYLIGRITRRLVKMTGLGFIDRICGVVLSVIKFGLVLSLAIDFFIYLNRSFDMVPNEKIESSILLGPLQSMSDAVFPYIVEAKNIIVDEATKSDNNSDKQ